MAHLPKKNKKLPGCQETKKIHGKWQDKAQTDKRHEKEGLTER